MATAPPTLPLQPMTKLIGFDDGLADLVSDVETLISFRGEDSPRQGCGGGGGAYEGGPSGAAAWEGGLRPTRRGAAELCGSEASVRATAGAPCTVA